MYVNETEIQNTHTQKIPTKSKQHQAQLEVTALKQNTMLMEKNMSQKASVVQEKHEMTHTQSIALMLHP